MAGSTKHALNRPLAAASSGRKILLLYEKTVRGASELRLASSIDGTDFKANRKKVRITGAAVNLQKANYFRLCPTENLSILSFEDSLAGKKRSLFFHADDAGTFIKDGIVETAGPSAVVPNHRHNGAYIVYSGTPTLTASYTRDFISWQHSRGLLLEPRSGFFDAAPLEVIAAAKMETGILILYESSRRIEGAYHVTVGAALAALDNPAKIIWRSEVPFWEADAEEMRWQSIGAGFIGEKIYIYFVSDAGEIRTIALPNIFLKARRKTRRKLPLKRHSENPIIAPRANEPWEMKATFNPAAVKAGDKIHLLYRAIGHDDLSVLGHAATADGLSIDERSKHPVFRSITKKDLSQPALPPNYSSGGGLEGGCEDPRLVNIDGTVYLMYTAFDGWGSIRMALSSIKEKDFLSKKWRWTAPMFLSPAGQINKNWVLFPEKINGKFAILHSISPEIQIDYVDDLKKFEDEENAIQSRYDRYNRSSRSGVWDTIIRGSGPPPIRTDLGWLLLYHAMDIRDPNRYKLGAILLDLDDPTKVLCRSRKPILEPDEDYENRGAKAGVVYACGAVVKDKTLYVYYGGSDSVACVATADIDQFLKELQSGHEIHVDSEEILLP